MFSKVPKFRVLTIFLALLLTVFIFPVSAYEGEKILVSEDSNGVLGNAASWTSHTGPSISADGRYVVFTSSADNLVAGDTNGKYDVFVCDLSTNITTRVSVSSAGAQGNDWSDDPSISADGRYVAFRSASNNLVTGDTNNSWDIFVRDTSLNFTIRVSVDSSGVESAQNAFNPQISANGRYVVFTTLASNLVSGDTNAVWDIFTHDIQSGQTARVSVSSSGTQGNGTSDEASISADGRYVAFYSASNNLVTGDTNSGLDIFVRDMVANTTSRISVSSSGTQANVESFSPFISEDGRYVLFSSYASNLVSGDTNGNNYNSGLDVFLRDTLVNTTTRVSVETNDQQIFANSYNASISANGRYVTFETDSSSILLHDRVSHITSSISAPWGTFPSLTPDGKYLAFTEFGNVFRYENDYSSPSLISIKRAGANYTSDPYVYFTVTFSETVKNVDANDFTLAITGVTGASIASVTGFGATRSVAVGIGKGNGTIRLDALASATITDVSNNPLVALPFTGDETYTISQIPIFIDVPFSYWANKYIERLYNSGITGGCSTVPLNYCPDATVTRAQMAVFLLKGMHGSVFTPPDVGVSTGFTDVATDYWAASWIKQLAAEGITGGCGVGIYCPDATVTRAQMAVFLLKAKHGSSYSPPAATGVFTDVPTSYWAAAWIEQLALEGVTSGCGTGIYCPDADVTRAQMAVFLVKAFNLP